MRLGVQLVLLDHKDRLVLRVSRVLLERQGVPLVSLASRVPLVSWVLPELRELPERLVGPLV